MITIGFYAIALKFFLISLIPLSDIMGTLINYNIIFVYISIYFSGNLKTE